MKIPRRHRGFIRTLRTLRTLSTAARTELHAHHERLGVEPDLGGACAFASVLFLRSFALYRRRNRERRDLPPIRPLLVCGWFRDSARSSTQHCWVEIGDIIVDLTATQFGQFPRARLCPRTNIRYSALIATGSDAERLAGYFDPSPRRRKCLLASMVLRTVDAAEKELVR